VRKCEYSRILRTAKTVSDYRRDASSHRNKYIIVFYRVCDYGHHILADCLKDYFNGSYTSYVLSRLRILVFVTKCCNLKLAFKSLLIASKTIKLHNGNGSRNGFSEQSFNYFNTVVACVCKLISSPFTVYEE